MVELNLTKRQQEIFDFIKRYSAKHGYPPTVRDIGKAVGLTSSSTVHAHLANLEKLGLLRRDPTKPRAIELLGRQGRSSARRRRAGCRSSARSPPVSRCWPRRTSRSTSRSPPIAGGDDGEYMLRVRGESMKDAGILEGDHVVVRPQETAADGEIVVALVGEEATVKRFFKEADHVRLQPENAAMEPIRSTRRARARARRRACLPEGRRERLDVLDAHRGGTASREAALARPPARTLERVARAAPCGGRRRSRLPRRLGGPRTRTGCRLPGLRGTMAAAFGLRPAATARSTG